MKKQLIQVAIDGPAGVGKTTVGQIVATQLNIPYLSTGRIFRSYAYALRTIDCKNQKEIEDEIKQFKFEFKDGKFYINDIDVSMDILSDVHSLNASVISSYPNVRKRYQKDLHKLLKKNSFVMDGRDIGTVIIPDSPFKFFLEAAPKVRATRRGKELGIKPGTPEFEKVLKEIQIRDKQDTTRKIAPLKKAKDALLIETDHMTAEEVAQKICDEVNKKRELFTWKASL